jgi:DNA-binding SARP family transcriptional activator
MLGVRTLTVDILGPLRVGVDGRPVRLTTGRLRTMLAGLAVSAGRTVSVERMTAIMWTEKLPADPRRSLQTYAARHIESGPAGWSLRVEPDAVDALRFARLLDAAAVRPEAERELLGRAMTLWRGEPFDGVPSGWFRRVEQPRLAERYLAARERCLDLDVERGAPLEPLIAELEELTGRHPLRESLWVRLMTLLERSGRPAEALQRYEIVRCRIAEELGTDPSPRLRELHARLLAGEPTEARIPVRRQLPPGVAAFADHRRASSTLDRLYSVRRAG